MRVVDDDAELKEYIEEAVRVSPDKPILVDQFLADAIELDVDAVSDGEDVLIGGIMEHVEAAGVHSGDSACVIPPRSLDDATLRRVREVVETIADALDTVGLMNVQLAVKDGEVYVLEANPRSSRTVPFVSKATGVPIAKLAAKVMAGETLDSLDVDEQVPEHYSVKEVVLPFDRLPESDPRLGPEMKSTGEVMGTASNFGMAYWKAQDAAGNAVNTGGKAVVELEEDPEGDDDLVEAFDDYFTVVDFDDTSQAIVDGAVDLLVSDDPDSLTTAVEEDIAYLSTRAAAEAYVEGLAARDGDLEVLPVSDRPRHPENWG